MPGEAGADWEFRFVASPDFREKFERARTLLSGTYPEGVTQEQVFEAALDEYLRRHDPARPVERSPRGSERLLCSAHNRRQAERDLGTAWRAPFKRRE